MRKTKLAMAALAALSSVSVYAAESDFSITPSLHALYSLGEAGKKVFTKDQLPHGAAMDDVVAPDGGKGHCSSRYALLLGPRLGYDVSESLSVILSGYFAVKPFSYEAAGGERPASSGESSPGVVKNTLTYSPHMLLAGVQYKLWSSDTLSVGFSVSGGGAAWGLNSSIDKELKIGTKDCLKSLESDFALTFAVLAGANLDIRLNEMISVVGTFGWCLLGEPQLKSKFIQDDGDVSKDPKVFAFGGVIHNIAGSIGVGVEF